MHEQTDTPACKTGNWPACNKALRRRGSLTIWFDPAMTWEAAPTLKRGRQPDCSVDAIQTPDDESAFRHGAPADDRVRREPVAAGWPRLGGAGLQHAQPPPEDVEGQHPLSRISRSSTSSGRHRAGKRHRFERTGEGASRSRAKGSGTPASMAARSGPRRFARTVYGRLPRDKGLVIFGIWSGAAMYSASLLRCARAP